MLTLLLYIYESLIGLVAIKKSVSMGTVDRLSEQRCTVYKTTSW